MNLLLIAACLLIGLAAGAALTARTRTPPFLDDSGHTLNGSIAEERRVELGGVEQYVLIRGRDRSAPLLVYVHGGPGATETPLFRHFNAALEDRFVTVYWDQRGAGKSFDSTLDPATLSIERMTSDLSELIDRLLAEFAQDQVLLLAHSWGTILGLEHIVTRPSTVAAYIAVSQITNTISSDTEGYEWVLAKANDAGDSKAVAALVAIGRPPYSVDELQMQRRLIAKYNGVFYKGQSLPRLMRTILSVPEIAWPDLIALYRGMTYSMAPLWPEWQSYDAPSSHSEIAVPTYFMAGRHDHTVSAQLSADYLDVLDAPEKELIWFENSAHMLPFEESEQFNTEVLRIGECIELLPPRDTVVGA